MAKSDFVPRRENDLLVWHDRFLAEATAHGAVVGLGAGEITSITNDNTELHTTIAASTTADAAAQQATSAKKLAVGRAIANVRTHARRVKQNQNYTVPIGEALGIEGPEDTTDIHTSKPVLTGKNLPMGAVQVAFNKSLSDGINLYCMRDGDAGWVFLARDTHSPYVDNRPLLVAGKPETRTYRAFYIHGDEQVGTASDEIVMTCQP